jgi:hypothetical protein
MNHAIGWRRRIRAGGVTSMLGPIAVSLTRL